MARPGGRTEKPDIEPVIGRQVNVEVLSAAIEASSAAPSCSTGCIRRIGKRAEYSS